VLRSAAIALGNRPDPSAFAALARGLEDSDPLVRGACAWALGRFPTVAARDALLRRQAAESDPAVQEEITQALKERMKDEG
jgi:epoxyqueuosine reductase